MARIGTLTTGAGVQTVIAGNSQCEQYLLLGDVDTPNALQGLQVEIDGTPYININGAALLNAFQKWAMEMTAGAVGIMLKIATGVIEKNTTYRFTNSGATTPNIFAFSDSKNGVPLLATSKTININSYEDFDRFSALFLETPANILSLEMIFADGHRSTLSGVEADAYFSLKNNSDANGQLGTVTVIDNTDQSIKSVRVNTQTGALTVLVVKIPDSAFEVLKG
jgi:hypothetical protein